MVVKCPKCKGIDIRIDQYLNNITAYKDNKPVYTVPCVCRSCGNEWEHSYLEED